MVGGEVRMKWPVTRTETTGPLTIFPFFVYFSGCFGLHTSMPFAPRCNAIYSLAITGSVLPLFMIGANVKLVTFSDKKYLRT